MDWRTWSPFQSRLVKEICSHMAEDEMDAVTAYAGGSGVVGAIFFAIPLSFGLVFLRSRVFGVAGVVLAAWLTIGVFVLMRRRRRGKELLCATRWAKSQGITVDRI